MEEEYHDIITTLQVIRLLQLFGQQELESKTTPFKGSEDDTTMPAPTASPTTFPISTGPITHSQAKKIQQEVHTLLYEFQLNTNDNFMLPKFCMLILLRYVEENHQDEGHKASYLLIFSKLSSNSSKLSSSFHYPIVDLQVQDLLP
jgi:hypothetical protein